MVLINNVKLSLETDFENLPPLFKNVKSCRLYRKSVDARRKNDVHFCCSFLVEVKGNEQDFLKKNKNAQIFEIEPYKWQKSDAEPENRPIIVGFGPAGMFCGLTLARAGLKPLIIERGSCVEKRKQQIADFLSGKPLNVQSNVQFGEGGAGTFSDGKLTTGIKNFRCHTVLEVLAEKGANKRILTDAKPHIGTDVLTEVVKNIREEILSLGGEILFDTQLEDIIIENQKIKRIIANGKAYFCDYLVVATGHSARDTYRMLLSKGANMVQKPFAVGVRIEHLQEDINKSLYGDFYNHPALGVADYKLACHLENGRGVYTFCMCPGGEVINASSEENRLAVNGMSNFARNGKNANSALLVGVEMSDFGSDDILAGCAFQEKIEQAAYSSLNGVVPINTVDSFINGKEFKIGRVKPSVKPKYGFSDFKEIFPDFVIESLKEGIIQFGKKIKGFDNPDAVLTAPETRSSAPVRVLRNEEFQSTNIKGLYPCGEGAGYAGGIVSAAVDGICVAEQIIKNIN